MNDKDVSWTVVLRRAFDAWIYTPTYIFAGGCEEQFHVMGKKDLWVYVRLIRAISHGIYITIHPIDRFFCSMIGAKSFIGNDSSWKVYNIYIYHKPFYTNIVHLCGNTSLFHSFIPVTSLCIYVLVNSFISLSSFPFLYDETELLIICQKSVFSSDFDDLDMDQSKRQFVKNNINIIKFKVI